MNPSFFDLAIKCKYIWGNFFMSKNTSISLNNHFEKLIERQIKSGRFASASEVIRAGLRKVEQEEVAINALRKELIKGINSGQPRKLKMNEFKNSMRNKYGIKQPSN